MAIGTGLAILGSSLIGAGASAYGSKKQAQAVKGGEAAALAENARQFDLVRSDTAPIRALGASATDRLAQLYGFAMPGTAASAALPAPTNYSSPAARIIGRAVGRAVGREPITYDNNTGAPVGGLPARAGGAPDMSVFMESPDYQFNLAEGQKAIDRSATARHGLLSGAATKEGIRYASGMASREFGSFVDRLMQQAGLGSNGVAASAAAGANSASNVGAISMNSANSRASIYGNNAANINNAVQGGVQNWMLHQYLKPPAPVGGVPAGYPGMG